MNASPQSAATRSSEKPERAPVEAAAAQNTQSDDAQRRQWAEMSDEDVRQGRIVLNSPRRRRIFIAGLVVFVFVAVIATGTMIETI